MSKAHETPPLDILTSALGGRRINTLLWALWLFGGVIANYIQTIIRSEVVHAKTKGVLFICILGFVIYSVLLIRGLLSRKRRVALLSLQSHLPPVPYALRFFVWLIAFLALGAALSPVYFR